MSGKTDRVRTLNGRNVGGCATLRKGVVIMNGYIRFLIFAVVIIVAFTIKVK